jgi:hypothetical protein
VYKHVPAVAQKIEVFGSLGHAGYELLDPSMLHVAAQMGGHLVQTNLQISHIRGISKDFSTGLQMPRPNAPGLLDQDHTPGLLDQDHKDLVFIQCLS